MPFTITVSDNPTPQELRGVAVGLLRHVSSRIPPTLCVIAAVAENTGKGRTPDESAMTFGGGAVGEGNLMAADLETLAESAASQMPLGQRAWFAGRICAAIMDSDNLPAPGPGDTLTAVTIPRPKEGERN